MDALNRAFKTIERINFVPSGLEDQAGIDIPLPIGFGQTISQPSTVRMMLEWLDPQPGQRILDIGSGSGWTSALLSNMVGPKGKVYAVERIPTLIKMGRDNCLRIGTRNVEFFQARENLGLEQYSPYDRILVSAAAQVLPDKLLDQLNPGGKLIIPINNDILEISKSADGQYKTTTHPGFVFVPLL
jgi:protein-L-isoaspartate(D-aspartate) O-methyltransferase